MGFIPCKKHVLSFTVQCTLTFQLMETVHTRHSKCWLWLAETYHLRVVSHKTTKQMQSTVYDGITE